MPKHDSNNPHNITDKPSYNKKLHHQHNVIKAEHGQSAQSHATATKWQVILYAAPLLIYGKIIYYAHELPTTILTLCILMLNGIIDCINYALNIARKSNHKTIRGIGIFCYIALNCTNSALNIVLNIIITGCKIPFLLMMLPTASVTYCIMQSERYESIACTHTYKSRYSNLPTENKMDYLRLALTHYAYKMIAAVSLDAGCILIGTIKHGLIIYCHIRHIVITGGIYKCRNASKAHEQFYETARTINQMLSILYTICNQLNINTTKAQATKIHRYLDSFHIKITKQIANLTQTGPMHKIRVMIASFLALCIDTMHPCKSLTRLLGYDSYKIYAEKERPDTITTALHHEEQGIVMTLLHILSMTIPSALAVITYAIHFASSCTCGIIILLLNAAGETLPDEPNEQATNITDTIYHILLRAACFCVYKVITLAKIIICFAAIAGEIPLIIIGLFGMFRAWQYKEDHASVTVHATENGNSLTKTAHNQIHKILKAMLNTMHHGCSNIIKITAAYIWTSCFYIAELLFTVHNNTAETDTKQTHFFCKKKFIDHFAQLERLSPPAYFQSTVISGITNILNKILYRTLNNFITKIRDRPLSHTKIDVPHKILLNITIRFTSAVHKIYKLTSNLNQNATESFCILVSQSEQCISFDQSLHILYTQATSEKARESNNNAYRPEENQPHTTTLLRDKIDRYDDIKQNDDDALVAAKSYHNDI